MKGGKFSLESVLVLRRFRKMEAAAAMAKVTRERLSIEGELANSETEAVALEDRFRRELQKEVRGSDILLLRNAMEQVRIRIAQRQGRLREVLSNEQNCRDILLRHQTDEKAILQLKKKQHEFHRKELERIDELAAEDFTAARHANITP